jgi:very-short-patch-repair endonuclease
MRTEPTGAEAVLWDALRDRRLGGAKFRRQHALGTFVLDFYCPAARLCIEVDGEVHDDADQQVRDEARSRVLAAHRIRVLRIRNDAVLTDLGAVLRRISSELAASD